EQGLIDRFSLARAVEEDLRTTEATRRGADPLQLQVPVELVEAIDEHDLALVVHDDEHGVVLEARQVEAGIVALVGIGFLEFARGNLPNAAEDRSAPLEELATILLQEGALGKAALLLFDQRTIEVRIGPGRRVPGRIIRVLALASTVEVIEPALPLGRAD